MDEPYDDLDDAARRALEVALAAAAAIGDQQCGTEYLLYGLFAGGRGEMAEIADLFVLDALRVERAIQKIREPFTCTSVDYDGDPQLTPRALAQLAPPPGWRHTVYLLPRAPASAHLPTTSVTTGRACRTCMATP